MLNLINFALGALFVWVGLSGVESGYLWSASLVLGGVYIGHAITEALNDHTD